MNLYKFEVKWYDSTKNDFVCDCGFVTGDTFFCALKNIENHYLNDSIENISIERINTSCNESNRCIV